MAQVKPLKYKELRQQSKAELESAEAQFQEEEVKLQLQSDILATQKSLVSKKKSLQDEKANYPFKAQKVIDLQIEVEGLEDGLKRLQLLEKELF